MRRPNQNGFARRAFVLHRHAPFFKPSTVWPLSTWSRAGQMPHVRPSVRGTKGWAKTTIGLLWRVVQGKHWTRVHYHPNVPRISCRRWCFSDSMRLSLMKAAARCPCLMTAYSEISGTLARTWGTRLIPRLIPKWLCFTHEPEAALPACARKRRRPLRDSADPGRRRRSNRSSSPSACLARDVPPLPPGRDPPGQDWHWLA